MAHQHDLDGLHTSIQGVIQEQNFEERSPFEQVQNFDQLFPELDFSEDLTQFIDYELPPLEHHNQFDCLPSDSFDYEHPKELPQEFLSRWLECSLSCSVLGSSSVPQTYGRAQYPYCVISPLVASLVNVNAISWIYRLCGQLPCQILPGEPEYATLSYKAVLEQPSMYPILRVLVSRPAKLASRQSDHVSFDPGSWRVYASPMGLDPLVLVGSETTSIRTHLENTLQLIHMGLSGYAGSRGKRQDDIRDLEHKLDQAKAEVRNRTRHIEELKASVRSEEILNRQRTSIRTFYESLEEHCSIQFSEMEPQYTDPPRTVARQGLLNERRLLESATKRTRELEELLKQLKSWDPWQPSNTSGGLMKDDNLDPEPLLCTPVITPSVDRETNPTSCTFEQLWRARSGLYSAPSRDGYIARVPSESVVGSDNVPLSLDQALNNMDEPCQYFRPSLLQARFERWLQEHELEQQNDYESNKIVTDEEDLLLLEAESDFLHSTHMDVDTYENLCQKHRLSGPGSTREARTLDQASNAAESRNNTHVSSSERHANDHGYVGGNEAPDPLDHFCTMNEQLGQDSKETRGEPAMRLPRILAWSTTNTDAILLGSVIPSIESDFIIEEAPGGHTQGVLLQGSVKEVWPKLDRQQRKHLMASLVRIVVAVWNNFDFLGGSSLEEFLDKDATNFSTCSDLIPLQDEAQIHERTRLFPSGNTPSMVEVDMAINEPSRPKMMAPADDLCRLEDEFMCRSFLDAFNEATVPLQHGPTKRTRLETATCGNSNEATVPLQHGPTKRTRLETATCSNSNDSGDAEIPSMLQGGNNRMILDSNPLRLDDTYVSQRMTTTREKAQESTTTQSEPHILLMQGIEEKERSWMRQLDFSLDDLLVQVGPTAESPISQDTTGLGNATVQIVGVSRWKTFCPVKAEAGECTEWLPRSANETQKPARSSSYPLVHLLSLPDVFCPVEFGGQGDSAADREKASQEQQGEVYDFARLLAQRSREVAEFLTMSVADKERVLYHRWMAAWHERSPHAPKATRARFDIISASRRYKEERRGYGNGNGNEMDNSRRLSSARDVRQRCREQQPRGMAVRCAKCEQESIEREQMTQELGWFEETTRFLDEIVAKAETVREQDRESEDERLMMTAMGVSARELRMAMGQQGQVGPQTPEPREWLSPKERSIVRAELSRGGQLQVG